MLLACGQCLQAGGRAHTCVHACVRAQIHSRVHAQAQHTCPLFSHTPTFACHVARQRIILQLSGGLLANHTRTRLDIIQQLDTAHRPPKGACSMGLCAAVESSSGGAMSISTSVARAAPFAVRLPCGRPPSPTPSPSPQPPSGVCKGAEAN